MREEVVSPSSPRERHWGIACAGVKSVNMKRNANKVCVLLVEEDQAIRETMAMILESEGYEVHSAEDGEVALQMMADPRQTLPDLIITDLMMPNITGWEMVDMLRKVKRTHAQAIIVYSSVAHYAFDNKILRGCYFLRKPVEIDLLIETVKKALGTPINPVTSNLRKRAS